MVLVMTQLLTIKNRISSVIIGGGGWGGGAPPSGITFGKMTQGVMTPPNPPSSPSTASLNVAAVIDLFSRRVVGWSMSAGMTAQLVTDALVMAIWRRGKPDALLHHSDRGSQYTSEQFLRLMADHGVICSMSRSGNVWDNAAMESFFSSLKTERTGRKLYRTRDDAKSDVFDYIERFYNPKRRHSTISYLSPMEFETQAGFA
jgi:putative transposase